MRQVLLQEVLGQTREERLIWPIESVDRTGSANCGDSSLLGLLVDDSNQRITDEIVAQLAFHNTWTKALIHELAPCILATLQVFANTF
eukprot:Skav200928  [mRNA]  locus=scaffold2433:215369:215632:- [translate_table: standard]